ncbi:MAG TPA: inorganic phosphate transporter [Candidatus Tectomicrobia bacterium]|jgi:PiT family inorganic phosphate transporter|nr:inorganic phosphate transporter [Candidatus Tectomicrobia bacterium]
MLDQHLIIFGLAVALAYLYAFMGGFTDAANAIATSVGTRVLSPRAAVMMAGVFNLLGGLTGTAVALTIGAGLVDPSVLSLGTVIAALAGAMTWSLFTYIFGIPVSETHGLIGGLVGAAVATAGLDVVQWRGLTPVLGAIIVSPSVGFVGGSAFLLLIYWSFRRSRPGKVKPWFRHLQRLSAAYMAFSHGRNDAQKPMGILAMALALYVGEDQVHVPLWVVVSCAAVAAFGTAYGGWRIIQTLGQRITALDPVQGFAAEAAGATVIQVASELGIPVSTTHAITSSILGVGATRRLSAIRWAIIVDIFASWLLTLPVTIALGALWALLGKLIS